MKANTIGSLLAENVLYLATAVSGTTPIVSDPLPLDNLDGVSFVAVTTGTIHGTFKIEASNNYLSTKFPSMNSAANQGAVAWADVTSMFSPALADPGGAATTQYTQCFPFVGRYLRVTFTPASGAGNVSLYYSAKGNR